MEIYLLSLEGGRCIFYSEGPEAVAEAERVEEPRRGVRGWLERKYRSLQQVLNESEKGVGLRVRRAWEWLQRRISPDESVLRALRNEREIKLYHPPEFSGEEARATWKDYLKSREGRHTFWFVANALFSPLTLLLAPLPGPNLIGYWFVYRAVCHWLARLGARRARSDEVETTFISTEALDGHFGAEDNERIASLSTRFGLSGLGLFIKQMSAKREAARG